MAAVPFSQRTLIKQHSIHPRKKLGQHFLVDEELLDKIGELCQLQKEDTVVEIGPGLGGLTTRLAGRVKTVLAIEKDGKLANLLRTKIIKQKSIKVIHQDALHFDYHLAAAQSGGPLKVVGNLPYNIASPLTIELLRKRGSIESLVCMYQKEVAKRITASAGTRDYGVLTAVVNLYADVEEILSVGKQAFYPQPKVDSTLIRFKLLSQPREDLENEQFFMTTVKSAFSQRRKKLRNALRTCVPADVSPDFIETVCREAGIDPDRRGETLTVKEFARLANHLLAQPKIKNYSNPADMSL
jgi:16S rRNA (adenine1518-N6/adenine1519-N6)-dimethyltransferase